jgi:DNA-binding Lrp family transcriptional regulator
MDGHIIDTSAIEDGAVDTTLDELDSQVIALLQKDGRRPYVEIARLLGVNQVTVKNRIEQLEKSGVCRVVAYVNPGVIGHTTDVFVWLQTRPDRTRDIAQALPAIADVFWVGHTTGVSQLVVQLCVRSLSEVGGIVQQHIAVIDGVLSTETVFVTDQTELRPMVWHPHPAKGVLSGSAESVGGESAEPWGETHDLLTEVTGSLPVPDDCDLRVLELLRDNGRRSSAWLAREVGISQSMAKRRLVRLIGSGVCAVRGVVNPEKLGYEVTMYVGLKVDLKNIDPVIEALVSNPDVYWLARSTGRCDILLMAVLRDTADACDFLQRRITRIPSLRAIETTMVLEQTFWSPFRWRPKNSRRSQVTGRSEDN